MTPRVVMVSPNFYPYVAGAEKQAFSLSAALVGRGASVQVITRRLRGTKRREAIDGVDISRLPTLGAGSLDSMLFLAGVFFSLLARSGSFDVVHVHLAGSAAVAAAFAARLLGKRVVVKVGGGRGIGEIAVSSRSFLGRLKLGCLRRLRPQLVAVTRDLIEELKENGLGDGAVVIPNGVDVEKYRPAGDERKSRLRTQLGWGKEPAFLYVGRLAAEKRLPEFVDAFAKARGESKARLYLVGEGPQRSAIQDAASGAGIDDSVVFLGSREDVDQCYAAADAFVLPSVSEGLSNALLEAMASGNAVVATRVGGTPDAVDDRETGRLVPSGDWGAMQEAVASFIANPELARKWGAQARARVEADFSLASVAERYLKLYNQGGGNS